MEACLWEEEGRMLRKSVFYLKEHTYIYVCVPDENKNIELGGE